ncbi:MAG: PEP-CTERM sorting domain-containing protein [Verrucomicrobiales bacterium]|jgi:hypothetical protein
MRYLSKYVVACVLLFPSISGAAITLNVDVEGLRNSAGAKAPVGTTRVFVVANSGAEDDPVVGAGSFTPGDFLSNGGDDLVLAEFPLLDLGATSGNQVALNNLNTFGANVGDQLRLVWFTNSPNAGAQPTEAYGSYSNGLPLLPGPGASISFSVLSTDATTLGPGPIAPAALNANLLVAVPEPSTSLLVGLAFGFLFVRRKK